MSAVIDTPDHHAGDHHHGPAKGLMRWVLTTNHKDIGTLYLWFSFMMFLLGGSMAMVIRAELFQPGLQIVEPAFFNQMTTMHGLIMVFGAVMPAFVGLANWMIPLMIGAPDMALPRMNNFSFWLLPAAFGLLVSTLFMPGGGPNFGWTFYAPLSTTFAPHSVTFFIFAIHLAGISSIMGAINVIATILNLRAPGMTLMKMPLFVWTGPVGSRSGSNPARRSGGPGGSSRGSLPAGRRQPRRAGPERHAAGRTSAPTPRRPPGGSQRTDR